MITFVWSILFAYRSILIATFLIISSHFLLLALD